MYKVETLHQCDKRVKTKSQKVAEKKLGGGKGGSFCPPPA